jgi:hypothetical protein
MAFTPSTTANAVIYNEEFYSGMIDVLEQASDGIQGASRDAIRYITQSLKGDFEDAAFWELGSNLVNDRDPTDVGDVDVTGFNADSIVAPKMSMRLGPRASTDSQWKRIQQDPQTASFVMGQQLGKELSVDWLNRSATGLVGALTKNATTHYDVSGEALAADQVASVRVLNRALGKLMGDARQRVVAILAHSTFATDLTDGQLGEQLTGLSDIIAYTGGQATLGLPLVISDSPALIDEANGTTTALLLTVGAVEMVESEGGVTMEMETILGKGNIIRMIQGETAANIRVKGFSYTGSANPDVAAIGNSANWEYKLNSVKSGPGIAVTVKTVEEAADAS